MIWRLILRLNIACLEWCIRLYSYQLQAAGPSVLLTDRVVKMEAELGHLRLELWKAGLL